MERITNGLSQKVSQEVGDQSFERSEITPIKNMAPVTPIQNPRNEKKNSSRKFQQGSDTEPTKLNR